MIGQISQLYQLWNKLSFEWPLLAVLLKNVLFSARGLPIVGPGVSPENIYKLIIIKKVNNFFFVIVSFGEKPRRRRRWGTVLNFPLLKPTLD